MIELDQLTKQFDDFTAVDHVSLQVEAGQILALLGPNGAGKTTTVRMLSGILKPTSGRAVVAGFDVVQSPREVRGRVGLLTEHPGLYLRMRGREYLDFFGDVYGLPTDVRRKRAAAYLAQFDMLDAVDRRLGEYSKGMRQKMAMVRALLHEPSVLLLDEPTSAMDPLSAKLVRDAIASLRNERRAIVLCTHNLPEAELLADRIAVIRRGQIVAFDTPLALKTRLLGPPEMELRLSSPLDGVVGQLDGLVDVHAWGESWLRYRTDDPAGSSPRVLAAVTAAGAQVVTLSEVPRSLESVYLRVVEG